MSTLATLILLGASVRAAAESAVRAGIEPCCIDLFADSDTQEVGQTRKIQRYPTEFLRALAEAPQAPWMYTGSLENYPRLIARMARVRALVGNGAETLQLVRDPAWLARVALDTGARYPETVAASGLQPRDGWLLKPLRSGGGLGIVAGARDQRSGARDCVIQQFVDGEAFSASFLAHQWEGEAPAEPNPSGGSAGASPSRKTSVELLGTAGQWSGPEFGAPQPFQYAGSYAAFELSAIEMRQLTDLATKLATVAGLRGLFGLDLIRGQDGLWLIEVNPRYTASMELLEARAGRSFVAEHCAEFGYTLPSVDANVVQNYLSKHLSGGHYPKGGEEVGPRAAAKPLSKSLSLGLTASRPTATLGKLIVYADNSGIVGERYQTVINVIKPLSTVIAGVITRDLPTIGSVIERRAPICTVIASAESVSAVRELLSHAAEQIRQSLDPLRGSS